MAIDLRRRGFASEILGVEKEPVNAEAALKIVLVDRVVSLEEGIEQGDIVIIAVPVGAAAKILPQILDSYASDPDSGKIVIETPLLTKRVASIRARTACFSSSRST